MGEAGQIAEPELIGEAQIARLAVRIAERDGLEPAAARAKAERWAKRKNAQALAPPKPACPGPRCKCARCKPFEHGPRCRCSTCAPRHRARLNRDLYGAGVG